METVFSTKTSYFKSANTQWLDTEPQQSLCGSNATSPLSNGSWLARLTKTSIKMPQFLRLGHGDMSSQAHVFSEPQGNDTKWNDATLSLSASQRI
jgi:hypothetical protein